MNADFGGGQEALPRRGGPGERQAVVARTFGRLSLEEAAELERIIEEGCENVNEHGW